MATRTSNKAKEQTSSENVEIEKKEVVKPEKKVVKYDFSDVDVNEYIPVLNGFEGKLIYKSKKTGEKFEWDKIGDEQLIELIEHPKTALLDRILESANCYSFRGESYRLKYPKISD